jgi:valyl-tRNA synthetase
MNGVFADDVPMPGATPPAATATVNRWIIGETARTLAAVNDAFESFRFNDAANALYAFVWGKVCDWYVEFAKPLFDGDQADETRATMRWVLDQCFILLHPIMPFITEELWSLTGSRQTMCVHAAWPTYGLDVADAAADREMSWVLNLIETVRSTRMQMRVPVGLKLPMLVLDADAAATAAYDRNASLIERLARLDGLHPGDVIDIAAETARLSKTLDKLHKDIGGLQGRLGNPRFIENAAEEVVEEARATLAEKTDEATRLRDVIEKLESMA